MLKTRFTELVGCSVPIQQAGMGSLANPELAAAVSEAGGLGMVTVTGLPTPNLIRELETVRKRTSRPFGANFIIPHVWYEDLKEIHEEVRAASKLARVVEFFYGDPDPTLVKIVHGEGALACWQVGSKDEAVKAVDAGCDLVVAQGIEAGGHIRGRIGLLALLDHVLSAVDVPVLAAGGIGSGRAVAAVLAMGASGVRVGTRFVVAREAHAHPEYQKALIKSEAEDTVFTETFSEGWPNAPHRVLRSSMEAAQAFKENVVGHIKSRVDGKEVPIHRLESWSVTDQATGHVEAMPLWAGEGVGRVRSVQSAASIVNELATDAEKLLRQWR